MGKEVPEMEKFFSIVQTFTFFCDVKITCQKHDSVLCDA